MTKQHAKLRPPSSADRWLSCPGSVRIAQLYPREDSSASLEGDEAHDIFESCLLFGMRPYSDDPDINESVMLGLEWVEDRKRLFPDMVTYAERRLEIPETSEFGTTDWLGVHSAFLHVGDFKNGYVPVQLLDEYGRPNGQMMIYLCGAIALFGPRPKYFITVIQPNYDHIEGPIRTLEITPDDVEAFRARIAGAMASDQFMAGSHCKKTYCDHRGTCQTFLDWAEHNSIDAWWPSEVNATSDERLSKALDHAEILQGTRAELRKEAMRRIMNMDRQIPGYKVVKGRRDREITDRGEVRRILMELGATEDDLYETVYENIGGINTVVQRKFVTAAGAERFIKKWAQLHKLPRGGWKQAYDNTIGPYIREFSGNLTLEKATDGRPAHKRGNEFGAIVAPDTNTSYTV